MSFYAATSKPEVLARAKKDLGLQLIESHCDDNVLVDDIVAVEGVGEMYVELIPTNEKADLVITSGYVKL